MSLIVLIVNYFILLVFLKKSGEFPDKMINEFAALIYLNKSKEYLEKNIQLLSQETIKYLISWEFI